MRITLAVETITPMLWCVRDGFKWHLVERVVILTQMQSGTGKKSPHAFLWCDGYLTITPEKTAIITRTRQPRGKLPVFEP